VKIGGQVIWATEFEEERSVEKRGGGGGKSTGGPTVKTVRYSYFANVAIGLCEGPVNFIRRVWADGEELDLAGINIRFYAGTDDQEPDPLIVAKQETGEVPAFRGLAYIVFERLPLSKYGNRLPQMSFEIVRAAPGLTDRIRAINLIPGSTEFGYATNEVRDEFGYGSSKPLNRAQWTHATDWEASLDAMTALMPNLERVSLISSWFGDDLRVGTCTLRPKVEKATRTTSGETWQAAGLTRASANVVSDASGRPSYGGSPSDRSIIEAIRDLKARGLKVALHPFILMDIPGGNGKTDPWTGATSQPAYPWRGRITCHPAPEQAGTPDGTAAAATQVAAFIGTASAAHFALSGDNILYSGPAEWSFRRMVLHHAMLVTAAGGVDTFILSSELIGLTRIRSSSGVYPFVQAMLGLLADLRSILGPQTVITYAADWTEYGAHVLNNGQEVRFPLDPLWAHAEIGAVGIDFYAPLSDWRDENTHLDVSLASSALDPDYLAARLTAGEAFDWYYASNAARIAQSRTAITDGAYGKPWIHRQKDLKSWWSNPHVERVGGVELAQPTAWQAGKKPIYLTEIGCPAVDKGGNAPNVFPDPKSIENSLPYFSNGARDDLVQRRVLEAIFRRFDPSVQGFAATDNPVATLYSGRMIDPSFIAPWAYDARPYPTFPLQRSLWADGNNWLHGHWLNGRLEAVPLDALVGMIATDFELEPPVCDGLDAMVDGYLIDRPLSARGALEPVAAAIGLSGGVVARQVRFQGRSGSVAATLGVDDLVPGRDGQWVEVIRRQESELPARLSFGFIDDEAGFREAVVAATVPLGHSNRETSIASALHLPKGQARRAVERRLRDEWAARETFRFSLRPHRMEIEPGDIVSLPVGSVNRLVEITRISDALWRECEARAVDPKRAEPVPGNDELPPEPGLPALPGGAYGRIIELPIDQGGTLLSALVRADPWRGPYAILKQESGVVTNAGTLANSARIGATLTTLPSGPLWRWDRANSVDIQLEGGALTSLGEEAVLAGGNALALVAPDGEVEIILARSATLVGEKRYRLSGLVRGLGGSEAAASRTLAPGAEVIVIDDALIALDGGTEIVARTKDFIILPAGRNLGDPTQVSLNAAATGIALRPLSPVHPKARREAGGVRFSFIRRTRNDGDSFELYEVPLGEEVEAYSLDILAGAVVKRSVTLPSPEYLYPNASEIADFGAEQSSITIRVRQNSLAVGPGAPMTATVPIL